jgi:primosomal protein N' (replication factor Y)
MIGAFSEVLKNEIAESIKAGEQVILFQNRRGYAPFIVCDQCAHTPKCRNCDVSLTRHKKSNLLKCHYCGYQISMIHKCPECKVGNFSDVGAGTERIEEELSSLFPHAKIARFDLDSTRKKNAFQNLLNAFETKQIDILIGTQMVTKGLDFENVGLVGIINADNMLRFPDFRSFERTFQMLTQVSGRAGRKKKRGKVIIQTYDPFHPVIQYTLSNNFKGLVKAEMQERKLFKYPPFYRILDVKLKHRDRQVLYEASRDYGLTLKRLFGERLLGPEFPYIERIRNLYSMHFILKVSKADSISAVKKKLAISIENFTSKDTFKSLKVQVDVDPY